MTKPSGTRCRRPQSRPASDSETQSPGRAKRDVLDGHRSRGGGALRADAVDGEDRLGATSPEYHKEACQGGIVGRAI